MKKGVRVRTVFASQQAFIPIASAAREEEKLLGGMRHDFLKGKYSRRPILEDGSEYFYRPSHLASSIMIQRWTNRPASTRCCVTSTCKSAAGATREAHCASPPQSEKRICKYAAVNGRKRIPERLKDCKKRKCVASPTSAEWRVL